MAHCRRCRAHAPAVARASRQLEGGAANASGSASVPGRRLHLVPQQRGDRARRRVGLHDRDAGPTVSGTASSAPAAPRIHAQTSDGDEHHERAEVELRAHHDRLQEVVLDEVDHGVADDHDAPPGRARRRGSAMIVGGIIAMNVPMFGMKLAANTRNAHRTGNGTPSTSEQQEREDRREQAELRPHERGSGAGRRRTARCRSGAPWRSPNAWRARAWSAGGPRQRVDHRHHEDEDRDPATGQGRRDGPDDDERSARAR